MNGVAQWHLLAEWKVVAIFAFSKVEDSLLKTSEVTSLLPAQVAGGRHNLRVSEAVNFENWFHETLPTLNQGPREVSSNLYDRLIETHVETHIETRTWLITWTLRELQSKE